ncbi:hypothetical protein [Ideonella dechloratans]|uniref:hypothetical protein n=1 Tax=Ideonella dechloratans TaxID=36863 RepID=UPI0035AE66EA
MPRIPRRPSPIVPTIQVSGHTAPLSWRQVLGLGITVAGSCLWMVPMVHGMAAS